MNKLLQDIKDHNILLEVVDGKLKIFSENSHISPALAAEIKKNRNELIRFLLGNDQNGLKDTDNIPVIPIQPDYVLSSSQRRLWILSQFEEGNIAYNMPGVCVFQGALDLVALTNSFDALLERHEGLRTTFKEDDHGEVRQVIHSWEDTGFKVAYRDLRNEEYPDEKVKKLIAVSFSTAFDLESGPLIRAALYQVSDNKWIFSYVLHHIISDGWSMNILVRELLQFYQANGKGDALPLSPLRIQYKDYAAWQQTQLNGNALQTHKNYWFGQLNGELPVLELPGDRPRPPVKTYNGGSITAVIGQATTNAIKAFCHERESTLFMGLLSAVNALLFQYTGQTDIVIGSPIAGRVQEELENQIGFYVNTLPLRTRFLAQDNYQDLLNYVRQITLGAYEHQLYPFDELVNELYHRQDRSRNPFFDVYMVLQNAPDENRDRVEVSEGLVMRGLEETDSRISKFDLAFHFTDTGEEIKITLIYNNDIYDNDMAAGMADHLVQMMDSFVKQPSQPLERLDYLRADEKYRILTGFNDTTGEYPGGYSIIDLFQIQAESTPDNTALVFGENRLSYRELNEKSNQVGHYLQKEYKIQPDNLVGVMLDRSEWMIICILGVLKSGGAYVPMDPRYPQDRVDYMVEDSQCSVVLDEQRLQGLKNELHEYAKENLPSVNSSGDLAYVIYTSGSTGKPKGVMLSHGNVVNFFSAMNKRLPVDQNDCMLAVTSTSFDISVLELFWTLCNGIEVVIHSSEISLNTLDAYSPNEELEIDFSLFFFSSYNTKGKEKYKLLLESVKYADKAGFKAVWTPERHFHEFGGLFPNPSVINSALAMITNQIQLRGGSVVAPLHDEIRIAEEWSVVDNLSEGRVGLSFASGWNPNDFALSLENYKGRQKKMYEQIATVRALWKGERIIRENGLGKAIELEIFPAPVQKELPVWVTSAGNEETFISAGAIGANILTHFLGQDIGQLSEKIKLYRASLKSNGYDERVGKVTVMLHTYIGEDIGEVERIVEQPFIEYLKSSIALSKAIMEEAGIKEEDLSGETKAKILKNAFKRYYKTSSLIGTIGTCSHVLKSLKEIGVDEVACLIDFGVEQSDVLAGLKNLKKLKTLFSGKIEKLHKPVTILQSTPSFAKLLTEDPASQTFLKSLRILLIGGEQLPLSLVKKIKSEYKAAVYNMYGPTETTIWSCIHAFADRIEKVLIGKPILNTQVYILNKFLATLPIGVAGDIYIGGQGVARGYLNKPGLTAEKFIADPFKKGGRLYKTGDWGRWLPDGSIEFTGRKDEQVKIRGYRIELGEIESSLENHQDVESAVVTARNNEEGEKELVAYVVARQVLQASDLRNFLGKALPTFMVPQFFVQLEKLPLTPNGKVDRRQLPDPAGLSIQNGVEYVMPRNERENRLAGIWQEIFGRERIGIKDNFFDLGGHSLKVTRLAGMIHKEFEIKIPVKDLFTRAVLEEQAQLIEQAQRTVFISIPAVAPRSGYALSSAQRRLWVASQLEEANVAYNVPGMYVFEGHLDDKALSRSFNALIERHEILRTVFKSDEQEEIRQFVLSPLETGFKIEYQDLRGKEKQEQKVQDLVRAAFVKPFDLVSGPLLRAGLYRVTDNKWIFVYVMHHIVGDGWSTGILIRELLFLYQAYSNGRDAALPPLRIQYKDYAAWQQEQLKQSPQLHRAYWLGQFEGELPELELPIDKLRPSLRTYNGGIINDTINKEVSSRLKALSQEQGGTLFMSLLAAIKALLYRYTGQNDIIIGTPIAGREHEDLEGQIGFYINTLAIRSRFKGSDNFRTLLEKVRKMTLNAYDHQAYPFDELLDELNLRRDMNRNPLFDIYVVLQNINIRNIQEESTPAELRVNKYEGGESPISRFDLIFDFVETGEEIQVRLLFNSDIYHAGTARRILDHLQKLLAAVIEEPSMPISQLDYLDAGEKHRLLVEFNDTAVPYPIDKTIAALFEEQASAVPDKMAVLFGGNKLTYKELSEKSNQLAHYLKTNNNVQPNDLIGIMLDRSEKVIIAILGILKAGGGYVPIDPSYPDARKDFILQDTGAKVLITQTDYIFTLDNYQGHVFAIDVQLEGISIIEEPVRCPASSVDLAYVMYTSGSTGTPKGVMIEQRSVIRLVKYPNYVTISDQDNILSLSSFSFDGSVFDIFGALLNGATLFIPLKEHFLDFNLLARLIDENRISIFFLTTALFNSLTDTGFPEFSNLRYILFGGERVSLAHVRKFKANCPDIQLVHVYGPTENTTFSSYKMVEDVRDDSITIPIGKGISNSVCYILNDYDEFLVLAPTGVTGEIYVGGDGLARGYLNNPELTAAKFINNPFKAGERLYKTGDLGRWLPDGNIEFSGRKDDQIKIRGFRIELGEIESTLLGHPDVDAAVVTVKSDKDGENTLIAYLLSSTTLPVPDLAEYLAKSLPAYMLPSFFIQLEEFPLTPNGKVDKRKLPAPRQMDMETGVAYIAPRNTTEERLVRVWEEILGREKIGIRDDFFEIGGHSLKATRLASQIHKEFDIRIELKEIFVNTTLEEQARLIEQAPRMAFVALSPVPTQSGYILSSSQRRLWALCQFKEGNVAYNISCMYVLEGSLHKDALEYAFHSLLDRHESLRTVFKEDEQGEVKQFILSREEIGFKLFSRDLRSQKDQHIHIQELTQAEFTKPFNLGTGPLLRAGLYHLEDKKWTFSYVMHHIISDGWSMNILINELLLLYNAHINGEVNPLHPLRIHYKDYATWQQEQLHCSRMQIHRAYWLNQFEGELPVLDLPADRARPMVKTYNGGMVGGIIIDKEICSGMLSLCREQGCTLFMSLLAAINTLLYRYSGQQDIVIGSPIAGREHADLEDQIGFYLNTLALRTRFKGTDSYKTLMENVKRVTLDAYAHQAFPFDELIGALHLPVDISRNPLFSVWVVLQNNEVIHTQEGREPGELKVVEYEGRNKVLSKFDLLFNFVEIGDELQISITYNSDIYLKSSVLRLSEHLRELFRAIVQDANLPVDDLEILQDKERHFLLTECNATGWNYPDDKTVIDLFEEQADAVPNDIAVTCGQVKLTYRELNEKSNQLAGYLKERYKIQANELVGIKLDRSEWVLIAILGVLKSGAAYVPVDPEYPQERVLYMMSDSQCKVVIDQDELERYRKVQEIYSCGNPAPVGGPGDLAYVIYTSGSTGYPKGVMIKNKSLVDYFYGISGKTNIKDCKSFGLVSTIAADLGNTVIYAALLSGGALSIFSEKDVVSPERMVEANVDCLKITPSHWKSLQMEGRLFSPHKCLIFGGEQLTEDVLKILHQNNGQCKVYNHYGPSETTIGKLIKHIEWKQPGDKIPLGVPFGNTQVYILDDCQKLRPIGVVGEICIGGDGLAKGYLNKPALTAEKFIPDPFRKGQLIYKTGDLGKWLPEGFVEFIGRKDDQVKIRGFRTELGEIEFVLRNHPQIDSAAVLARADKSGELELIAYIVTRTKPELSELNEDLRKVLPDYMLPAHYVVLDKLPLTTNGKIDRKKLPDSEKAAAGTASSYIAPRNETEEKLARIWQNVLEIDKIGINDDFFALGGHSLKAIRLSSQIYKEFEVKIDYTELFARTVLAEQARLIGQAGKTPFVSITPVAVQSNYALSSSQRQLWILSQFQEGNIAYNRPAVYIFEGDLNSEALSYSFNTLIERHESLRTIFKEDEQGDVKQFILSPEEACFSIRFLDLRMHKNREGTVKELVQQEVIKPFDLRSGPLIRVCVFQVANDKWIFTYTMHHIISDAWSQGILINELLLYYNTWIKGGKHLLPPLRIQCKDHAAWQQAQLNQPAMEAHKSYWLNQLDGDLPVLNLPGDRSRPAVKMFKGGTIKKILSPSLYRELKALCQQEDATLFMGLLAVVNTLLYRYTGQQDIIIGCPIAGREHPDLEGQIGFYLNTLALRTRFNGSDSYKALLGNIRQLTFSAFQHQAYPFNELVEALSLQPDISRNPLFELMLVVQTPENRYSKNEYGSGALKVRPYEEGRGVISKFDLTLTFDESGEELYVGIEYNSDIFNAGTIERMAGHLEKLIGVIVRQPSDPILQLDYLGEAEKHQLLTEFNNTGADYAPDRTVIDLLEAQVARTPGDTALIFEETEYTYKELNDLANFFARSILKQTAVRRGDCIAVLSDRSAWSVISMIAIMKLGCIYVPIDASYPKSRIKYILNESQSVVLITDKPGNIDLDLFRGNLNVVATGMPAEEMDSSNIYEPISGSDSSFIIYTSGSTGDPKGVEQTHRTIYNLILWDINGLKLNTGTQHLQFSSFSFDSSLHDIYYALSTGGVIHIVSESLRQDLWSLKNYILEKKIATLSMPYAALKAMFGEIPTEEFEGHHIEEIISTGEQLYLTGGLRSFLGKYPSVKIHNLYGPSETHVVTGVSYSFSDGDVPERASIGSPIHNTIIYILDTDKQPVPIGVEGEIYIGGWNLAKGYYNSPELTKDKFIKDPFKEGEIIYRSGDIGKWLPTGNIEYVTRRDNQLKINGYRIELGEIEQSLRKNDEIDEAVVLTRALENNETTLVAYLVSKKTLNISEVRNHLRTLLPGYMIPGHYMQLVKLPLTSNGKVDKRALPDPEELRMPEGKQYVPPGSEIEMKLTEIWSAILGIPKDKIGIRHDFFELGGHSLKATRLVSLIHREFEIKVTLKDIFMEPTIERIAAELGKVLWLRKADLAERENSDIESLLF